MNPHCNIIVFGVGHCNTRIVCRQIHTMGWNAGEIDTDFYEHIKIRSINEAFLVGNGFDSKAATAELRNLRMPWVIKDPRFAYGALEPWIELALFKPYLPLLLFVTKSFETVKRSYEKRRESTDDLAERLKIAENLFELWPHAKVKIEVERVVAASLLVRDMI